MLRSFEASVNAGVVNTTDNLVLAQLDRNMEDITPVKLAPKDAVRSKDFCLPVCHISVYVCHILVAIIRE